MPQRHGAGPRPLNYILFVTFFPHLIAGPIVHHREIMPQFADAATYRLYRPEIWRRARRIFLIGLLKKMLLADPISAWCAPRFRTIRDALTLFAAWGAALAYSLQLYFDFSGYSDMAIGIARMCNVRFPLNFNSPYQGADHDRLLAALAHDADALPEPCASTIRWRCA